MQSKVEKGHVLVVGDVILERYWQGPAARLSPEAPVPIVQVQTVEDKLDGAGNIALNLASLSSPVSLLGAIGQDETGRRLQHLLQDYSFDADLIPCYQETITQVRVTSRQQQMLRLELGHKVFLPQHQTFEQRLLENFTQRLKAVDVVVLSEQSQGDCLDIQTYIQLAKQQAKPVIVQANHDRHLIRYQGANLLILSSSGMALQAEDRLNPITLEERCASLVRNLALDNLLVIQGRAGMSLFYQNQAPYHLKAPLEEVYDETGVSGAVTAVVSRALANNYPLTRAVDLANAAANQVARKLGSATVTPDALAETSAAHLTQAKILTSLSEAKKRVQAARQLGQKVVFTNGCFDLIHAGHIDLLQAAKQLGGCLIVAVNTDESVKRLNKGPNRPFSPLISRQRVLAEIKAVDWVIPLADETPVRLLEALKPDILVKGGDYKINEVVGAEQVLANGGQVLTVGTHYLACSSSKIIDQLPTDLK